ncbi:MAG: DUF418 domain-containing protein [Gammaproteobacteria bacterium]|nr:DUF418 domain-containing protein [Gammaproteobacteria bacterium]
MQSQLAIPTQPQERIESIDVLRGVVLLGILVVNIVAFGLPNAGSISPTSYGTFEGLDIFAYWVTYFVFEGSQRAVFSMLFGAGIVLFTQRLSTDERGSKVGRIFTRRMLALMLFGLVDIFLLLWFGDIIFLYALVGLVVFFFRDTSVRGLLVASGILFVLLTLYLGAMSSFISFAENRAATAMEKLEAGGQLSLFDQEMLDTWEEFVAEYEPDASVIQLEVESRQDGYLSAYSAIMPLTLEFQVIGTLLFSFWDVLLMMLVGMALFKLGILDGSKSYPFYWIMVGVGLGLGLAVNVFEVSSAIANNYNTMDLQVNWTYNLGRLSVACGLIGLVMLICKAGILHETRACLAAVGRMALTNYLVQSLICLIFFVVLGFFGELRLHQLFIVVLGIWVIQLVYSSLWLKRFRFGPLEWLWRYLTYGKVVSR